MNVMKWYSSYSSKEQIIFMSIYKHCPYPYLGLITPAVVIKMQKQTCSLIRSCSFVFRWTSGVRWCLCTSSAVMMWMQSSCWLTFLQYCRTMCLVHITLCLLSFKHYVKLLQQQKVWESENKTWCFSITWTIICLSWICLHRPLKYSYTSS